MMTLKDKTKISSTSTISYLFIIPEANRLYLKVTQCNGDFLKAKMNF